MAIIEKITLSDSQTEADNNVTFPGLRISIRSTTSSFSDYPEWNLEELSSRRSDSVVTDGACS